jgi:hypothetical protein
MHGRDRAEYKAKTRNEQVAAALSKKALHWNTLSNQILLQHKRNKGGSSLLSLSAATGKHNASINANVHLPSLTHPGESMSMSTTTEELNDGVSQHMDGATVMALTEKLLLVNPDPSYLWNVRRHVLLMGRHVVGGADFEVGQELHLSAAALERNPKAYGAWLHRKWSVRHYLMVVAPSTLLTPNNDSTSDNNQNSAAMSATLLPNELELCGKLLSMDERNFHCWNYRRFIVSALGYLIMKRHAHSSLFLQQATREDCSDFYFVRNCADHPYATKFAMDGSWKMWTDYINHNHGEHLLQQQEKARLLQEMAAAETPPGESDTNANINGELSVSSASTSNKPKKVGHRKQASAGNLSYLHGGKEDKNKRTSSSLMGPQLTSLDYTHLEENLHIIYDEEIPATAASVDNESEDLLTRPRTALLHLLQTEWDFTSQKMQDNFSNCSAFHYRSKLLPLYVKYCYKPSSEESENKIQGSLEKEEGNGNISRSVAVVTARLEDYKTTLLPLAMEELNLVRQAIYTEPDDQTPWWYHRFLLEWIKPPSLSSLLLASAASSRPASTGSQKQRSVSPEDEQEIRTAHEACVSTFMTSILQEDVEALEELLEAEDGQLKWAWMALHNLFGLLLDHGQESSSEEKAGNEDEDYNEKQRECITNLIDLDPDRRGRYLDMLHEQQTGGDDEDHNDR